MTTRNKLDNNFILKTRTSMDSFELITVGDYQIGYYLQTHPNKEICEDGLLIKHDNSGLLLAVCDGVGGSDRSYRATKSVLEQLSSLPVLIEDDELEIKLSEANTKLIELEGTPQTTLSMLNIQNDSYKNYQIGDSGALHCSNQGNLKLKSIMHSPVGVLVMENKITEEEALQHPELNIVSNILGTHDCYIDISNKTTIAQNDTVLLTTDGILDNYLTDELIQILAKASLEESCQKLTESSKNYFNIIKQKDFYKLDDISFICLKHISE